MSGTVEMTAPSNIPVAEMQRLLELHKAGTLHNITSLEEYLNTGVRGHRIVWYGDPIDMVKRRQKKGLAPTVIDCVKTSVYQFDVAQFNKQLVKRATRASSSRKRSSVMIRYPDENAAKEIIAKAEQKLLSLSVNARDKPAVTKALMDASFATLNVKDDVIKNLQEIGYITLNEKDGETTVSYKLAKHISTFVKGLLKYQDDLVTSSSGCNSQVDAAGFQSEIECTWDQSLGSDGLKLVKPESLLALNLLESMYKSRPKNLKTLEHIIQPVSTYVAITPIHMTFAKLADVSSPLKTIRIPFGNSPVFPFSLCAENMLIVPWKATDDATVTIKEKKKFNRMVSSNFRHMTKGVKDEEEGVECGLADAEKIEASVNMLQQWAESRANGIQSDSERYLEQNNCLDGVLYYKLSSLSDEGDLKPLTREDIYGILARMANFEVTYSPEQVAQRLEELGVLKAYADKVIFFVKQLRRLVNQVVKANKKVADYVSEDLNRYLVATETKEKVDSEDC